MTRNQHNIAGRELVPTTMRETILYNAYISLGTPACLACENRFAFVKERNRWVRWIKLHNREKNRLNRERAELEKKSWGVDNIIHPVGMSKITSQ